MKHLNRYIFLAILTMVAAGCMNEDEIIPVDGETGVKMTFTATIEEGEDTKTILGESDEHGHRKLLWAPEDSIGIVDNDWSEIRKFVNTKPETDVNGVFEGSLNRTYSTYYAVYPYKNTFGYDWSNGIKLEISQIAMQRIAKPADLLEVGQVVDVRITDIDDEKQKVSLSIRALLEEAAAAAEAMPEEYAAEEPATEE